MNDLTNYLLAACSLLFAGNMFFLRNLYSDFHAVKKETSGNTDTIGSHAAKIITLEATHKEKTAALQLHYDDKISEVKKSIEKQEDNLKTSIKDVSIGVRQMQEEMKKFYGMQVDVAVIKQILSTKEAPKLA